MIEMNHINQIVSFCNQSATYIFEYLRSSRNQPTPFQYRDIYENILLIKKTIKMFFRIHCKMSRRVQYSRLHACQRTYSVDNNHQQHNNSEVQKEGNLMLYTNKHKKGLAKPHSNVLK